MPVLLIGLALLGGAAHSPAFAQDVPPVVVERADAGTWRATYTFPEPVAGLEFERPSDLYREKVWRIDTPGTASSVMAMRRS